MDLISSIKHALNGLRHVLAQERNARIHLAAAVLVLALGVLMELTGTEMAAIFFAVVIVFIAEIANTALEKTLDIIEQEHSQQVKVIKDMTAGAVLVASVGAFIIGVAVFLPYILGWLWRS